MPMGGDPDGCCTGGGCWNAPKSGAGAALKSAKSKDAFMALGWLKPVGCCPVPGAAAGKEAWLSKSAKPRRLPPPCAAAGALLALDAVVGSGAKPRRSSMAGAEAALWKCPPVVPVGSPRDNKSSAGLGALAGFEAAYPPFDDPRFFVAPLPPEGALGAVSSVERAKRKSNSGSWALCLTSCWCRGLSVPFRLPLLRVPPLEILDKSHSGGGATSLLLV